MTLAQLIPMIEEKTGLTFKKSFSGSNSYYCDQRHIRISDHFSKYVEKRHDFTGQDAIDIVFKFESDIDIDYCLKLINKSEWFSILNKNVKINHRNSKVGEIQYLSHNEDKEYVEVLNVAENRVVKYGYERIDIIKQ